MIQIDFSPIFQYLDNDFKVGLIEDLKEIFVTKEEFRQLQTSVDGLTKEMKDFRVEMTVLVHRTDRMEAWIDKAAPRVGVTYEK